MEKYKIFVLIQQIKDYEDKGQSNKAIELANTLDFKKVRGIEDLFYIANMYLKNGILLRARECYLEINGRVTSRNTLMQLINLALRLKRPGEAERYLKDYQKLDSKDFYLLIFRYNIDKLEGKPAKDLIPILERLKARQYIESWGYELAKLYHKTGMIDKCIAECDDLILWFGNGEYVERAQALKGYYLEEVEYNGVTMSRRDKVILERKAAYKATSVQTAPEEDSQVQEMDAEAVAAAEVQQDTVKEQPVVGIEEITSTEEVAEEVAEELTEVAEEVPEEAPEAVEEITSEAGLAAELSEMMEEEAEEVAEELTEVAEEVPEEAPEVVEEITSEAGLAAELSEMMEEEAEESAEDSVEESVEETIHEEDTAEVTEELAEEVVEEVVPEEATETDPEEQMLLDLLAQESAEQEKTEVKEDVAEVEAEEEAAEEIVEDVEEEVQEEEEPEEKQDEIIEYEFSDEGLITWTPNGFVDNFFKADKLPLEKYLGYFTYRDDIRQQFFKALEIILNPKIRNVGVVIAGDVRGGKNNVMRAISRVLYRNKMIKEPTCAVAPAEKINRMNLEEKIEKLLGRCLVIENAGELTATSIESICQINEKYNRKLFVILTDTRSEISNLFRDYRDLNAIFPIRIHVPAFDEEELLDMACYLIMKSGYTFTSSCETLMFEKISRIVRETEEGKFNAVEVYIKSIIDRVETRAANKYLEMSSEGKRVTSGERITPEDMM